jgi:hypothetical protein
MEGFRAATAGSYHFSREAENLGLLLLFVCFLMKHFAFKYWPLIFFLKKSTNIGSKQTHLQTTSLQTLP